MKSTVVKLKLVDEMVHHQPMEGRKYCRERCTFSFGLKRLARGKALVTFVDVDVRQALISFSKFLECEVLGIPGVGFLKPGIKLRVLLVVGHRFGLHEELGLAKQLTGEMGQR